MGLLETIDSLDLSDEAKEQLRQEYGLETGATSDELARLRRQNRRDSVETEVGTIAGLFSDDPDKPEDKPVGLLKFVRRVLLSDDDEPGLVLLSDADLELSGDEATGNRSTEDISVANAVRKVFELMPKTAEGKINFSDQAHADDAHSRPKDDEEVSDEEKAASRKRAEKTLGRPIERKRTRIKGRVS